MNNQEAIDLLDNLIGMISDNQDSDYDEALKLGIKALSESKRFDGMTNGEVLQALFPDIESRLDERTGIILVKWADGTCLTN